MSTLGRPRALDETKRREILALISRGCSVQTAADYVGCGTRTIHREIHRNKEFWDLFRKAEFASTLTPLKTIQNAANSNWRAATWLLERKLPQNFAPTSRNMIDPVDLGRIFDRFFEEIRQSIPDRSVRKRILNRIERASVIAIHESCTQRKNPKIRTRRSPAREVELEDDDNPTQYNPASQLSDVHNQQSAADPSSAYPSPGTSELDPDSCEQSAENAPFQSQIQPLMSEVLSPTPET